MDTKTNHAILRDIDQKRARRKVRPYRVRLRVLFALITFAFAALILRLADLQIRKAHVYTGEAARRSVKTSLIDTRRGSIYDRNGRLLASDRPTFDICVLFSSPAEKDADIVLARFDEKSGAYELNRGAWLRSIVRLSGRPSAEVEETARKIVADVQSTRERVIRYHTKTRGKEPPKSFKIPEEVSYHPILADVDFDLMSWAEVVSDHFPGIKVQAKTQRSYPCKDSAAHVIGYTAPVQGEEIQKWGQSYDGSPYKRLLVQDSIGRTGIEKEYDAYLRGERGEIIEEVDVRGDRQDILARRPPVPGNDIHLTMDMDLQRAAETALGKQIGAIILMNPYNGEVLAMATYPRFDPNTFRRDYPKLARDAGHPLLNRATQAAVPPGSLFKIVTTTAGLETGALCPVSTFNCKGAIHLGSVSFGCWSKWGHGDLSLSQAIEKSCNVYFYQAGRKIGGSSLYKWGRKYGLGSPTGIEISQARGNIIRPQSTPEIFNMAIGQGKMLATPIQVARIIAVVANGGKLVKPHLLRKVVDCYGTEVTPIQSESEYVQNTLVAHEATIDLLRNALRNVITVGTASRVPDSAALAKLGVAGKTGTAQTSVEVENQAWFAGFAPYDHPQICFVVFAERVSGYGGETCLPIARPVIEYYFQKGQLAAAG